MEPDFDSINPANKCSKVVFPEPELPKTSKTSFTLTERLGNEKLGPFV
jgi:hypothetical protein